MADLEYPWIMLYRTAMLEFDREKLTASIRQAEAAIQQRMNDGNGSISFEERHALGDALHNLRLIARKES